MATLISHLNTAAKTLSRHPRFFVVRAVARFEIIRTIVIQAQRLLNRAALKRFLTEIEGKKSRFFPDADPIMLAASLERDGMVSGLNLPGHALSNLVNYAMSNPCWADRNVALGFMPSEIERACATLGREILLSQYYNLQRQSDLVAELAEDPVLVKTAALYLGARPKLVGVNMFWSYPAASANNIARSNAAQMFHCDLDDFKFLKFFFYLTDVDEMSGPHVAVLGTHSHKLYKSFKDRFLVKRYTDQEIESTYGRDRIVTTTGPAGTGFIEDTICLHKGQAPGSRERLVLQFQFALNDHGNQHDNMDESALTMIVPH